MYFHFSMHYCMLYSWLRPFNPLSVCFGLNRKDGLIQLDKGVKPPDRKEAKYKKPDDK